MSVYQVLPRQFLLLLLAAFTLASAQCPTNTIYINSQCVPTSCSPPNVLLNGVCVSPNGTQCGNGQGYVNGGCSNIIINVYPGSGSGQPGIGWVVPNAPGNYSPQPSPYPPNQLLPYPNSPLTPVTPVQPNPNPPSQPNQPTNPPSQSTDCPNKPVTPYPPVQPNPNPPSQPNQPTNPPSQSTDCPNKPVTPYPPVQPNPNLPSQPNQPTNPPSQSTDCSNRPVTPYPPVQPNLNPPSVPNQPTNPPSQSNDPTAPYPPVQPNPNPPCEPNQPDSNPIPTYPSQPEPHPNNPATSIPPTQPTRIPDTTPSTTTSEGNEPLSPPPTPPPAAIIKCPEGTILLSGKCRLVYCSSGIYSDGRCVQTRCPQGTIWTGQRCAEPKPIELQPIHLKKTIINPNADVGANYVLNNVNNLVVNASIALTPGAAGDYDYYDEDGEEEDEEKESSTTAPGTGKCCNVVAPRICRGQVESIKWKCFSRTQQQCGDFCSASKVVLKPSNVTRWYDGDDEMLIMPPNWVNQCKDKSKCDQSKDRYDCSGCAGGLMATCSSYCYTYRCSSHNCAFYDQEQYCQQYAGQVGCRPEDGWFQ